MSEANSFSSAVQQEISGLLERLNADIVKIKKQDLLSVELLPKDSTCCPFSLSVVGDGRCDFFLGNYGRFEYMECSPEKAKEFVEAVLAGNVFVTIWSFKNKVLVAQTKVKAGVQSYVHKWSSLCNIITLLFAFPWIKKSEIQYQSYFR
ncbi:MAG: hypothetical protein ACREC8_07450 [Limisphaerales bacterium]